MYFSTRIDRLMKRLTAVVIFFVLLAIMVNGSAGVPLATNESRQGSSWTIMVYMADDFTSSLDWQTDFNEMEAALQAPGTNIIALVDPYGSGDSALYKVQHDPNFIDGTLVSSKIDDNGTVISGGEVNMAEASTLRSFVEFAASTFPADKYVLILWGHGAGWKGLCPDATDILTLPELGDALFQATTAMGKPLDVVVVDSCAEAALETLWQIHEYSRYFVGSEKDVPFQGLPYDLVINDLAAAPDQSVEEFAARIADDYVLWSGDYTDYSVTMSVFNLSEVEPLVTALGALSDQGEKYDPIFHDVLRAAFDESEEYEAPYSVDFSHFMWQLQKADLPLEIRYYAIECLLKGEATVQHFRAHENPHPVNGVHVRNASGFTIFPPSNETVDNPYESISLATTQWFSFGKALRNDTVVLPNGPEPTVWYSSSKPSNQTNDIAHLAWPNGTETNLLWVLGNRSSGLTLEASWAFSGQEATVSGIAGPLTLAASSYADGILTSYRTVNITLEGIASIGVQVNRDGQTVNRPIDEYEITLITPEGDRLLPTQSPPTGEDDTCFFVIGIPDQVVPGDLVTIEVVKKSSGEIVGTERVFVPDGTMSVSIDLVDQSESSYGVAVPLLFALLPGILILGFALSLHFQRRKKKGDSEQTRISS